MDATEFNIGDGVGLVSDDIPASLGTVVDFVYAAYAPVDDRIQVCVYWRTSGSASDHPARELVRLP